MPRVVEIAPTDDEILESFTSDPETYEAIRWFAAQCLASSGDKTRYLLELNDRLVALLTCWANTPARVEEECLDGDEHEFAGVG